MISLCHDINEYLLEAVMSQTPLIVVEGIDDIQFYSKLGHSIEKNLFVEAIENIDGYSEGCDGVMQCIQDIQPLLNEENKKLILGVIDRDSRMYKDGYLPNLGNLFVLKYYSFESHFATASNIKKLLLDYTKTSIELIDENAIEFLESEYLNKGLNDLYYISLEALKNRCEGSYQGEVCLSMKPGRIFNKNYNELLLKIYNKKAELDLFARSMGIDKTAIKNLAKGKWLIHIYSYCILKQLNLLEDACKSNHIKACNSCKSGNYSKCLWKLKLGYQQGHISTALLNYFDDDELEYIKIEFNKLA